MADFAVAGGRTGREFFPAEGFAVWCRIEDLSALCGYDPVARFDLLRELPDAYPVPAGTDPEAIAEEHPMRALACVVARFLKEYPEEAEALAASALRETPAEPRPVRAA